VTFSTTENMDLLKIKILSTGSMSDKLTEMTLQMKILLMVKRTVHNGLKDLNTIRLVLNLKSTRMGSKKKASTMPRSL